MNPEAEKDGVWVEYGKGVSFKIAYGQNRKFRNRASFYYKKHSKLLDMDTDASRDKMEEITVQVMAETVLTDWRGAVKLQGETLEYSVANAKRLLAVEKFRDWVSSQANDMAKFKAVQEAEDEGN